ncbi:MAG: metal-dependent hydrolase [Micrococcales bacterium]|nr:MAG: metal-dependent hydrolase [Micrococcales bacterium]PIE26164.1 MAG: metal-dependent hydrolase [Micrococcales bacterium]
MLVDGHQVEVRRSVRRKRTVQARWEGDRIIVFLPTGLPASDERDHVHGLVRRLARRRPMPSDDALLARARKLNQRYLGGLAEPVSVRWVTNQNTRWGSCTPSERSIRLSHRLHGHPGWVIDAVLLHELAHLLEPGHGPQFWALLEPYDRMERARGYLEGLQAGLRERAGN